MMKAIILKIALISNAFAHPVGFEKGNEFVAHAIQGQVRVLCDGFNGSTTAQYTCREIALEPHAYDYVRGPQDSHANMIELVNTDINGNIRSKIVAYDGLRGRSAEAINLWISTIFQKPLLNVGVNSVRYNLFNSNQSSDQSVSGVFEVNVKRGQARICPNAKYISSDINDCRSQYSICQKYFLEFKNCN